MKRAPSNIKQLLLPVLFLTFLAVHFLDQTFNFLPELQISETRKPQEKPEFNIGLLDPYPKTFEAYYNDHFKWRSYFIKASTYLNYYTFKKSALPDEVIIGKEGWLFKSGHQLDVYRGKFRFTEEDLKGILNELEVRKKSVEAQGGKYYLSIPPLKHHIYQEFLPDNVKQINNIGCVQQLKEYLAANSDINYIDLYPAIMALKAEKNLLLYHKTDHHWTQHAAMCASQVILDSLRKDFPEIGWIDTAQYEVLELEYDGMLLASMLGLEKVMKEQYPVYRWQGNKISKDSLLSYPPPVDFPFPEDYALGKFSSQQNLPSLFMVRESFGTYPMNFLADQFEKSVYIFDNWKHRFNGEILAQEPSDIYIQFIWEGLLFQLMEKPPKDAGW